jgi:hypothetical protein
VRLLPWALFWVSVAFLLPGMVLRIDRPVGGEDSAFPVALNALVLALVALVGALIASRLPSNPYGWLWCALGLALTLIAANDGLRRVAVVPRWIPELVEGAAFSVILCLLAFVLLLFPTGRLPSRLWRWPAAVAVLIPAGMFAFVPFWPSPDDPDAATPWALEGRAGSFVAGALDLGVTSMFVLLLLAAGSVLVRFRRAGPLERQQLKWFLFAAVLLASTIVLEILEVPISDPVWAVIDGFTFASLPVAVGIAVLRYRLYEIDRIISRSVSYGLLTAGLAGMYLVLVALLRPLLEPLTGGSDLAVGGSTLAVAAAFNPARRRLQAAVDRRFDRARYDARRAVDAFARRLRDQVDLDQVTAGLHDTVVTTVAPTRVAVWLRDVPSPGEA